MDLTTFVQNDYLSNLFIDLIQLIFLPLNVYMLKNLFLVSKRIQFFGKLDFFWIQRFFECFKLFPTKGHAYSQYKAAHLGLLKFYIFRHDQQLLKQLNEDLPKGDQEITKKNKTIYQLNHLKIVQKYLRIPTQLPNTALGMLSHLKVLDLNELNLKYIPNSIYKLKNLEILLLCNNNLSFVDECIGNLSNLKVLNINNNYKIREFPCSFFYLLKINYISIIGTTFETISEKITKFKNLKIFSFDKHLIFTIKTIRFLRHKKLISKK